MRRITVLVVLIALGVGAWVFRDRLVDAWHSFRPEEAEVPVSEQLADRAERKLASMAEADGPTRIALSSAEVESLVAYRMAQALPGFILAPRVTVDDGEIHVNARVPTDEVAGMRRLAGSDEIFSILPDTTEVQARGRIIPIGNGRVALAVDEVTAAHIPLPSRIIPRLLERVGRVEEPGLPREALAVRLPDGIVNAYAHGDSVVFVSTAAALPAGAAE